ncbi:hypothetical protein LTR78_008983 [Recurvomyces mirabilis]|uniref:glucan 1,3-beta-glucosidase n=1 Tax=Recurvomyces mirabilis TaxID=574656 RepID=A0AAE0WHJ7_9PEZI|nr:hypothetical protein LTR78_008983 [Recurvomyces mirabilis]KAK5159783.1 hypothetical protein LTS14_001888 [Recurvomyces mirabilis]
MSLATLLSLLGLAALVSALPQQSSVSTIPTTTTFTDTTIYSTVAVATSQASLSSVLSAAQITQAANATAHGAVVPFSAKCPLPVTSTTTSSKRYAPTISWPHLSGGKYINWKTYKANGANLGGWLEKEKTHDPIWWDQYASDAADEWTFCQTLGKKCGAVLEARYTSFLNTSTIDQLASVGVNTLRIPTTYAAWVKVPGSQLYTGSQQLHLRSITNYAITKYNMHIIIGLHSLPGGVNNLDIGEALGHDAWFYNATNLEWSFLAVDAILAFIATNWILTYLNGVLKRVNLFNRKIPVMIQDCFQGASFWAPFFDSSDNIVFDSHVYYFAAAGTYSEYVLPAICGQAAYLAESETKFPTFVGEWALQVMFNNTLAGRKEVFDTQRYAWEKYVAGGSFWTAVSYATTAVDGQGTQRDYWSYIDLINTGVITTATNASYCE